MFSFVSGQGGRWRGIERAQGVASVIKFGVAPVRCPDQEIRRLLEMSESAGIVRLPRSPPSIRRVALMPGTAVQIRSLSRSRVFDGLYAGMGLHERELVLLNILWAKRQVEISAGLIAARSHSPGASPAGNARPRSPSPSLAHRA
jgi:hypothetical protein